VVWAAAAAILYAHYTALLRVIGLPGWQGLVVLTAVSSGAVALLGLANRIEPRSKAGAFAAVLIMLETLLFGINKLASMGVGGMWTFLAAPGLLLAHIPALWFAFSKITFPSPEDDPLNRPMDYYQAMAQEEVSRSMREYIEREVGWWTRELHEHLQGGYAADYYRYEYFYDNK